jgi:hypothetical protein
MQNTVTISARSRRRSFCAKFRVLAAAAARERRPEFVGGVPDLTGLARCDRRAGRGWGVFAAAPVGWLLVAAFTAAGGATFGAGSTRAGGATVVSALGWISRRWVCRTGMAPAAGWRCGWRRRCPAARLLSVAAGSC